MNDTGDGTPNRTVMIHTLAIVGFIALIGASMWLAVYSTRYVPTVVNRVGSAAVYLGSVFSSADKPTLSVIPTQVASTIISFDDASSTVSTNAGSTSKPVTPKVVTPTAGKKVTNTYQMTGSTAPYGLPDLVMRIDAVGYLTSTSTNSFVASSTVPLGNMVAVKFTVTNIGTNISGFWRIHTVALTQVFDSPLLESIVPGSNASGVFYVDKANSGENQMISVTANFDRTVSESNFDNNNASAKVTIRGN